MIRNIFTATVTAATIAATIATGATASSRNIGNHAPREETRVFGKVSVEILRLGYSEFNFNKFKVANKVCQLQGFDQVKKYRFKSVGQNRSHGFSVAEYKPVARYDYIVCERLPIVLF